VAAADLGETLNQLKQLETNNSASTSSNKKAPATREQNTKTQSTAANKSTEASQSSSSPARAGKTLGKRDGVEIKSYGSNDVHKPAHAHVKGGGKEVRIGPNGKPLKNQPELAPKQKAAVEQFKTEIRKELKKVGKANQKLEKEAKTN
jgi:hypothetical protein